MNLKAIYIASIGRSGSTLLESILGAHSSVATMGEIHLWPHELRKNRKPCACGELVDSCEFWSEVRQVADPLAQDDPQLDFFRERYNGGHTLRVGQLRDVLSPGAPRPPADVVTYGHNNRDAFIAYRDIFNQRYERSVTWVTDASKDAYRLAWLIRSRDFDLRIIHMVKDPRAYVYSVTKSYYREPRAGIVKRLIFTARQAGAWVVQNLLFELVLARGAGPGTSSMRVRYEDFVAQPSEVFAAVCLFIGIAFEEEAVENFRNGSVHTIAGNHMRYETRPIALDQRWRSELPRSSRLLVDLITGPFRKRFGY